MITETQKKQMQEIVRTGKYRDIARWLHKDTTAEEVEMMKSIILEARDSNQAYFTEIANVYDKLNFHPLRHDFYYRHMLDLQNSNRNFCVEAISLLDSFLEATGRR